MSHNNETTEPGVQNVTAFLAGFIVPNAPFSIDDFTDVYDNTLAADADYMPLPPSGGITERLASLGVILEPQKAIARITRDGTFLGSYLVRPKAEQSVTDLIEFATGSILSSGLVHGIVSMSVYTEENSNPSHYFVMEADADCFREVGYGEYCRLTAEKVL